MRLNSEKQRFLSREPLHLLGVGGRSSLYCLLNHSCGGHFTATPVSLQRPGEGDERSGGMMWIERRGIARTNRRNCRKRDVYCSHSGNNEMGDAFSVKWNANSCISVSSSSQNLNRMSHFFLLFFILKVIVRESTKFGMMPHYFQLSPAIVRLYWQSKI